MRERWNECCIACVFRSDCALFGSLLRSIGCSSRFLSSEIPAFLLYALYATVRRGIKRRKLRRTDLGNEPRFSVF